MNLNIWQILVLALLQGVTELFPISSLGHTVILPGLLGWGDLVRNQQFLPLIVALHLGTSIALVVYFWRDWYQVGRTLAVSIKQGEILDNWLRKVDSRVPNRGSPVPEGHGAPGRPFTRSVYVKLPLTGNMEMGYSGLPHLPVPF